MTLPLPMICSKILFSKQPDGLCRLVLAARRKDICLASPEISVGKLIAMPSGDQMAFLAFLPDAAPDDRVQQINETIQRLPEQNREILELRLRDGLAYAEIAEALSIPIGTVRSRVHNSIALLRRSIHSETPDP
jgi:DNA-directed RNA polymerase specialized sigma24 family protein